MPSSITRIIHRIFRFYIIVQSIIRGCEFVFVSINRLVLLLCIN